VADVQDDVLAGLTPDEFLLAHRYEVTPAIAGSVSTEGLTKLRNRPEVLAVSLDGEVHAELAESVPLINADDVHGLGFTGAGVVAAVFDTGIDTNHPDLADDLLAEECRLSATSDCPNGMTTQSGPGAAEDDNGHGSHVTGIITGAGVVAPIGVAPDTGIIAYKVLNADGAGTDSDLLAAADDIIANHPEVDIINMSLGDGESHAPVICDSLIPALTAAFSTLRSQNVVTFAASGNGAFKDGISYPACLSDVVSVGAVYDDDVGGIMWSACTDPSTAPDQVTCFSNSHPDLDLLAPGALILSAASGGGTSSKGGTSMASPHAAGVAALVRQASPSTPGDSIVDTLKATGLPVTDAANGVTTPRVDALAAVQAVNPTDSDGDGCMDAEELPMGFDFLAAYDFFDVPVPANPDPTPNGTRNRAVNLGDALAVLLYVGAFDNGPPNISGVDYDSDKDGDTVEDGRDYDRTPSVAPNPPWDAGPPNGFVNISDLLALLVQVGLNCSNPP
jgi:subtilisin family serine protease